MSNKSSSSPRQARKKDPAKLSDSKKKGNIVEQIVAMMHAEPGVKIQTNVFLPATDGDGRTREIDVLLTSSVSGYPVRIAIECKNWKDEDVIDVTTMGEFSTKLEDVGISAQHGIFVSVSRFTTGALSFAKKKGITPLLFSGLTGDRLSAAIQKAFKAEIYFLAIAEEYHLQSNLTSDFGRYAFFFVDEDGEECGTLPDLVWLDWINGKPPSYLGRYTQKITIPDGWHCIVAGEEFTVSFVKVVVRVIGMVATQQGEAKKYRLMNAFNSELQRLNAELEFHIANSLLPVTPVTTEEELKNLIKSSAPFQVIERVRLPRIRSNLLYWPPSERVAKRLSGHQARFENGEAEDPTKLRFENIEGTALNTAFEPIWKNHPFLKRLGVEKLEEINKGVGLRIIVSSDLTEPGET